MKNAFFDPIYLYEKGHAIIACNSIFGKQANDQDEMQRVRWQLVSMRTDGSDSEWYKPLNIYDAPSLLFAKSNYRSSIYFCFAGKDIRKAGKMIEAG